MSPETSFRTRCPHCARVFSAPDSYRGETVACPNPRCGEPVPLRPRAAAPPPEPQPPDAAAPAPQPEAPPGDQHGRRPKKRKKKRGGSAASGSADAVRGFARDQLRSVFEPLVVYWATLKRTCDPQGMAGYVEGEGGTAGTLYKVMGASLALTAAIEFVLPSQSLFAFTSWDKLDNLIMMAVWLLGALLTATVTFMPLVWLGGRGEFLPTAVAALYVTAVYYPLFSFIEGCFKLASDRPMPNVTYLTFVPLCQIVAKLHSLGVGRTMVAVGGACVVTGVLMVPVLIAIDERSTAPENRDAAKATPGKKQGSESSSGTTVTTKKGGAAGATTLATAESPDGVLPVGPDGRPLNLDFETGTLKDWTAEGLAFGNQPSRGDAVFRRRRDMRSQHQGQFWVGTYEAFGDGPQGTLTSVSFRVTHQRASFLVGGGAGPATCVELVRDDTGEVFSRTSGTETENMRRVTVDLRRVQGEYVFIRLVDRASGGWGHINFDDFRFSNE